MADALMQHTTNIRGREVSTIVRVCGQATNGTAEGFPRYHVESPDGFNLRTVPGWELSPLSERTRLMNGGE